LIAIVYTHLFIGGVDTMAIKDEILEQLLKGYCTPPLK
jgi:hypothetical protein